MLRSVVSRGVGIPPLRQQAWYSSSAVRRSPVLSHVQRFGPSTSRFAVQGPTFVVAFQRRGAANQQSHKPASDNIPHMVQNAKEEAKGVGESLAKGIAGHQDPQSKAETVTDVTRERGAGSASGHGHSVGEDFSSITSAIAARVPSHILNFGLAGSIPYLGTTLATLYYAHQAKQATLGLAANVDINTAITLMDTMTHFQLTYGAVLISFVGAIHWGLEFAAFGGYKGYRRLALGVLPLLGAWPTLVLDPQLGLVAQWFIFTGVWFADMNVASAGWTPSWYSQYRFYLSILVGGCIMVTLFGLNYLGPTTDATLTKELKETGVLGSGLGFIDFAVRDTIDATHNAKRRYPKDAELITEEGEDGYVKIVRKKSAEDEEEGDGEGSDEGEKSGDDSGEDGDEGKKSGDDEGKDSDEGEKSGNDSGDEGDKESGDDDSKKKNTEDDKSEQKEGDDDRKPKKEDSETGSGDGEAGENNETSKKERGEEDKPTKKNKK